MAKINVDLIYPIGSIYMSVNSTNPSNYFGGTWEQLKDRFLLGAGDIYVNGDIGGRSNANTMDLDPEGLNPYYGGAGNANWHLRPMKFNTPFSIMPPYLVVYMWKRIA